MMAAAPELKNFSFEQASTAPWVIQLKDGKASETEEVTYEGKKSLKLEVLEDDGMAFRAEISQMIPCDSTEKLQPSIWVKGAGFEKARLSIFCYNAMFSQSEELLVAEVSARDHWQELKLISAAPLALPEFTAFVQFRLVVRSKSNLPVWVDAARLTQTKVGEGASHVETSTSLASSDYLQLTAAQLQQSMSRVKPKVLILGDASVLGWNRTAVDLDDELAGDSKVMAWGFPTVSTTQITAQLKDLTFELSDQSVIALSLGYHDLLNVKLTPEQSVSALMELVETLKSKKEDAQFVVLEMVGQHPQVSTEWKDQVNAWNKAVEATGLPVIRLKKPTTGSWIQRNYLPNSKARSGFANSLLQWLKPDASQKAKE